MSKKKYISGISSKVLDKDGNFDHSKYILTGGEISKHQDVATSNQKSEDNNAVTHVMSVSKLFAVATLLRMMEEKQYEKSFSNNIQTKLSALLQGLKAKFSNSNFIQNELEHLDHFEDITLQHLMQHTSGIDNMDNERIMEHNKLADYPVTNEDFIEFRKASTGKFGESRYNNIGYSLLAMIAESISGKSFDDLQKELVINRLSKDLNIFTASDTEGGNLQKGNRNFENQVSIKNRPDIEVVRGFMYQKAGRHDVYDVNVEEIIGPESEPGPGPGSCGIYTNVNGMIGFIEEFYSGKLFKNPSTRDLLDTPNINKDGKIIGYLGDWLIDDDGNRGHSGGGVMGTNSFVAYNSQNHKAYGWTRMQDKLVDRLANEKASDGKIITYGDFRKFVDEINNEYNDQTRDAFDDERIQDFLHKKEEIAKQIYDEINQELLEKFGRSPTAVEIDTRLVEMNEDLDLRFSKKEENKSEAQDKTSWVDKNPSKNTSGSFVDKENEKNPNRGRSDSFVDRENSREEIFDNLGLNHFK